MVTPGELKYYVVDGRFCEQKNYLQTICMVYRYWLESLVVPLHKELQSKSLSTNLTEKPPT